MWTELRNRGPKIDPATGVTLGYSRMAVHGATVPSRRDFGARTNQVVVGLEVVSGVSFDWVS